MITVIKCLLGAACFLGAYNVFREAELQRKQSSYYEKRDSFEANRRSA